MNKFQHDADHIPSGSIGPISLDRALKSHIDYAKKRLFLLHSKFFSLINLEMQPFNPIRTGGRLFLAPPRVNSQPSFYGRHPWSRTDLGLKFEIHGKTLCWSILDPFSYTVGVSHFLYAGKIKRFV